jgi:hypothetical protein
MTPSDHLPAAAEPASELLAQRAQLQEWLRRLDTVDDIPPQVARRVRADYDQRLAGVVAQLSTHTKILRTDRARLEENLLAAAERNDACTDALEEARLRHRIGELSEEEWEQRRPELESELEHASAQLEETEEEIKVLDELLWQLSLETPPAEPGELVETVDAVEAIVTVESAEELPEAEGAWFDAPALAAEEEPEEWTPELPELESFAAQADVEPEPTTGEMPTDVSAAPIGDEGATAGEEPLDVSAYGPEEEGPGVDDDLVEITNFAAAAEALADEADPPAADDDYAFLQELDRAIAATAPTAEEDEEDADTRPQPGLKCPDCGYSNDPAAWYCGVCGVDLG